jgi:DNA-binding transcriptional LysR family regulator
MEEPIDRYFAANGFQARVIMRMDSAEAIKAMVRTGFGISMLPTWIVNEDLKAHNLSLIRQKDPPLKSKVALVGRNAAFVPQAVQAFCAEARAMEWKSPWLYAGSSQPPKRK